MLAFSYSFSRGFVRKSLGLSTQWCMTDSRNTRDKVESWMSYFKNGNELLITNYIVNTEYLIYF